MLAETLLLHRREGELVVPGFLDPADDGWLAEILVRRERAVGRPQVELEAILLGESALGKRRLVAKVLARLARPERTSPVDPARTRATVFAAAVGARDARREAGDSGRARAIASAATTLQCSADDIEVSLFADLPGERRIAPLPAPVSPESLRIKVNAALAAGFLLRAVRVTVTCARDPLPLLRHARATGLIAERREGGVVLSGPFLLFRFTGIYGRALSGVLPTLAGLGPFTATVDVLLRGSGGRLVLNERSPVFAASAARTSAPKSPIDRLVADVALVAPDWTAITHPPPLEVEGGLAMDADLLLAPPEGDVWRIELLRFWTAAHVRRRVEQWSAAGVRACLVLDGARNGAEEPAPEHASVIVYRGRPDAKALLDVLRQIATPSRVPIS